MGLLIERLKSWPCFLRLDLAAEPIAMTGYKARKLSHWVQDSVTTWSRVGPAIVGRAEGERDKELKSGLGMGVYILGS